MTFLGELSISGSMEVPLLGRGELETFIEQINDNLLSCLLGTNFKMSPLCFYVRSIVAVNILVSAPFRYITVCRIDMKKVMRITHTDIHFFTLINNAKLLSEFRQQFSHILTNGLILSS